MDDFLYTDGVYGSYYLVRTYEAGHLKCAYEGDKPSYDMSRFIPVPVSKGYFLHDIGLVCKINMQRRLGFS